MTRTRRLAGIVQNRTRDHGMADNLMSVTDDDMHIISDKSDQRGIFDGFDGYAPRSEEDWKNTLSNGLVVVDTNVLLSLYRYNPEARNSLLRTLQAFDSRLWVPNQVMVEFWRNHPNALEYPERQLEQ